METIELRSKPELKISWNQNGFQLIDSSDPQKNGDYPFVNLREVELFEGGTNWLVSILSFIIDIPTGGLASGAKYKNKPSLRLKMQGKNLKILLIDADLDKAKAVAEILRGKKPTHNTV